MEGGVPSNTAIALEVLQALMDEEEEVEEVPTLQRKRRRQESSESTAKVAEVPVAVEPPVQQSSPRPIGPEGSRGQASSAPEHSSRRAEGPSESAPSKKKKASKDKRAPPPIFLEGEDKWWKALRRIRANDSIGDLKTVKEYAYTMSTPRDMSHIRG